MSDQIFIKTLSDDGLTATVSVKGSLSIESSGEFHQALSDALKEAQSVVLNVCCLEEIELTALQVICSACKTASARQRSLVLEGEPPNCILALSKEIGAAQNLPYCCQDNIKHCIWYGGAK